MVLQYPKAIANGAHTSKMRRLPRKCDAYLIVMARKQHSKLLVAILALLLMPAMVAEAACWVSGNELGNLAP